MKSEDVGQMVVNIEKRISAIENELKIREYARRMGLDMSKAADYARAAIGERERCKGYQTEYGWWKSNEKTKQLLNGNGLAKMLEKSKNNTYDNKKEKTNKLSDAYKVIKNNINEKVRRAVSGGVLRNEASYIIAVSGSKTKNGPKETVLIKGGHSSDEIFEDADAVVIIPGQTYWKPYNIGKAKEGAIKFRDYSKHARVTWSDGVFKLHAAFSEYFGSKEAKNEDWVPPGKWPEKSYDSEEKKNEKEK